jgi:hypothetical protein
MEKETDERYLQRLMPVADQHGIKVWPLRVYDQ